MENLAGTLNHKGKNYLLKDLEGTMNLTKTEKKIIDARLVGSSFSQLGEKEIKTTVDQIMLRVAAICGCALPNTEFFAKFISEEISKFILDFGYSNLTLEETLLAFRLNSYGGLKNTTGETITAVSFTGNSVNVDYIAKVLLNYMAIRNFLDRKLQNKIDGYEL